MSSPIITLVSSEPRDFTPSVEGLKLNVTPIGSSHRIKTRKGEIPSYLKVNELASEVNKLSKTHLFKELTSQLPRDLRNRASKLRVYDDRIEIGVKNPTTGKTEFFELEYENDDEARIASLETARSRVMAVARGHSFQKAASSEFSPPAPPALASPTLLDPKLLKPVYNTAGEIIAYVYDDASKNIAVPALEEFRKMDRERSTASVLSDDELSSGYDSDSDLSGYDSDVELDFTSTPFSPETQALIDQNNRLEAEVERLKKEIESVKENFISQDDMQALNQQADALRAALAAKEASEQSLNDQLSALRAESEKLKDDHEYAKYQLGAAEQNLKETEARLNSETVRAAAEKQTLEKNALDQETQISNLRTQLDALNSQKTDLESEKVRLGQEIERLKKNSSDEDLIRAEAEFDKVSSDLTAIAADRDNLALELEALRAENQRLSNQLELAYQGIDGEDDDSSLALLKDEYENRISSLRDANAEEAESKTQLQDALNAANKSIAGHKTENESHGIDSAVKDAQISALEKQLGQQQKRNEKLNKRLKETAKQKNINEQVADTTVKENDALRAAKAHLKSDLDKTNQKSAQQEKSILDLENESASQRAEILALKKQVADAKAALDKSQAALATTEANYNEALVYNESLDKRNEKLKEDAAKLREQSEEAKKLQEELARVKAQAEALSITSGGKTDSTSLITSIADAEDDLDSLPTSSTEISKDLETATSPTTSSSLPPVVSAAPSVATNEEEDATPITPSEMEPAESSPLETPLSSPILITPVTGESSGGSSSTAADKGKGPMFAEDDSDTIVVSSPTTLPKTSAPTVKSATAKPIVKSSARANSATPATTPIKRTIAKPSVKSAETKPAVKSAPRVKSAMPATKAIKSTAAKPAGKSESSVKSAEASAPLTPIAIQRQLDLTINLLLLRPDVTISYNQVGELEMTLPAELANRFGIAERLNITLPDTNKLLRSDKYVDLETRINKGNAEFAKALARKLLNLHRDYNKQLSNRSGILQGVYLDPVLFEKAKTLSTGLTKATVSLEKLNNFLTKKLPTDFGVKLKLMELLIHKNDAMYGTKVLGNNWGDHDNYIEHLDAIEELRRNIKRLELQ